MRPEPSPARSERPDASDPVLRETLAELARMGMAVARVAARLAEIEGRAVEALAEAAVEAARGAVGVAGSLAEAVEAGQRADASDAARDAVAARVASITESFDKAARAVRRTVALQARLAEGRAFRAATPGAGMAGRTGFAGRVANDAERAERTDAPEWGDEIEGRSDEEVVWAICRDLGLPAGDRSRFGPGLPEVVHAVRAWASRSGLAGGRARVMEPGGEEGVRPEPDT